MKEAIFITPGNIKVKTTLNAIKAAFNTLHNKKYIFSEIIIINTKESSEKYPELITEIKKSIRQLIKINEEYIPEENDKFEEGLIKIISKLINKEAGSQLVIDITSGKRNLICALYAIANLCNIKDFYYFNLKNRKKIESSFESLKPLKDFVYEHFPPFKGITKFTDGCYVEIEDYCEIIRTKFQDYKNKNAILSNEYLEKYQQAIGQYFSRKKIGLNNALTNLSLIAEDVTNRIYDFYLKHLSTKPKDNPKWATKINILTNTFEVIRNRQENNEVLNKYENKILKLIPLIPILHGFRIYRNKVAHASMKIPHFKATHTDVRMIFTITDNLLEKFFESTILDEIL